MRVLLCALAYLLALSVSYGEPALPPYQPKAARAVQPKAAFFEQTDVKLLDSPLLDSRRAAERNLLKLDVERLLAPFVVNSRLEPKQPAYLGWETMNLPGVGLSFYLSGVARAYLATGDKQYAERIETILDRLQQCQKRTKGYLLGTSGGQHIFKRLELEGYYPEFKLWGAGQATPYYSLEKLMSGLRDVYRLTGNAKALQIEIGVADWLADHMSRISDEELLKIMEVEYGGMNWVLADLYADTGDKRYLELSRRWHDAITVQPMTKGIDVLPTNHANMQFPKFSGLAARYLYSGDEADYQGARFFWETVARHHSYATGGNAETEYFGPRDTIASRLTHYTEENCNVYNMLRLSRLLFEIEPNVEYAHYMERALYNHILAAQNVASGEVCYFLPLMPGAARTYQPLEFFSCCTASGLDSYTRHAEYIYAQKDGAVYVNLFVPSELNVKGKGLRLRQETAFPDADTSKLIVSCDQPAELELLIRNPAWAARPVTLSLNGGALDVQPAADGYFHVKRQWKNGDTIELTLPMALRAEAAPDDKSVVTLFRGPILLAGELSAPQAEALTEHGDLPGLITGGRAVDAWLAPGAKPLTFTTTVAHGEQLKVMPLFRKQDGVFAAYWRVTTVAAIEAAKQQRAAAAAEVDRRTIDRMTVADPASEKEHKLTFAGRNMTGQGNGVLQKHLKWRQTDETLSYELAVSDAKPNVLFARYIGRAQHERWNSRLLVDGVEVKVFRREENEPFPPVYPWTDTYPLPIELTRGKKSVKVTYQALSERAEMPRILELRTLKP